MGVTSEMVSGEDAAAFGRHFFDLVRATSGGGWVRYRDLYNRTVRELPGNAFVLWLAGHPRRRAKVKRVFVVSTGPHPYSRVVLPDEAVVAELASRGRVLRTDADDEACGLSGGKVGSDADESPGGCSSAMVRLTTAAVQAGPSPGRD